jgi:hypothetical protein
MKLLLYWYFFAPNLGGAELYFNLAQDKFQGWTLSADLDEFRI